MPHMPHIPSPARRNRPRQHGFSLLEALVTIVVVSVGLLGILGLQTASMVNTRISASRSNATVAADNFSARMRSNPAISYDDIKSKDVDSDTNCTAEVTDPYSRTEIRTLSVCEWSKTLERTLPKGRGLVECVDSECDRYRITIAWDEHDPMRDDDSDEDTSSSAATSESLCDDNTADNGITRCFITEVRI